MSKRRLVVHSIVRALPFASRVHATIFCFRVLLRKAHLGFVSVGERQLHSACGFGLTIHSHVYS